MRSKGAQVLGPGGFAFLYKAAEEGGMSGSTQGAGCDRQKLWPGLAKYIFLVSGLDWTLLSVLEVVLICSCSRGCLGSLLPPSLPSLVTRS